MSAFEKNTGINDCRNQCYEPRSRLSVIQTQACAWQIAFLQKQLQLCDRQLDIRGLRAANTVHQNTITGHQNTITGRQNTIRAQRFDIQASLWLKTEFIVTLFFYCLGLLVAIAQGWKKPGQSGYQGLLAAGIITGIVSILWIVLVTIKVCKEYKV